MPAALARDAGESPLAPRLTFRVNRGSILRRSVCAREHDQGPETPASVNGRAQARGWRAERRGRMRANDFSPARKAFATKRVRVASAIREIRAITGRKRAEIRRLMGRQPLNSKAEYAHTPPFAGEVRHVVPSTIQIRKGARRRASQGRRANRLKVVASSQRSRPRSHWPQAGCCRTVTRTARGKWL